MPDPVSDAAPVANAEATENTRPMPTWLAVVMTIGGIVLLVGAVTLNVLKDEREAKEQADKERSERLQKEIGDSIRKNIEKANSNK